MPAGEEGMEEAAAEGEAIAVADEVAPPADGEIVPDAVAATL